MKTLNTREAYERSVSIDPGKTMTELKTLIPSIVYDLRYAAANNFVKRPMYPAGTNITFLRSAAAIALKAVQDELANEGLGLKIYDAYRPYTVSLAFWEIVHDVRYVARPTTGSAHNRGLAVDLTLVSTGTGKELDMGTDFDDFSTRAGSMSSSLPAVVKTNRSRLRDVMLKHGFRKLDTEWWHFSWPNDKGYEVLDLGFEALR